MLNNFLAGKQVKSEVQILKTLSKDEQTATATRKEEVKKGLAKLGIQCDVDKIPNIAVLGSGGGLRAMIALYGTLSELKKCNLLDCIMYLFGVSGSTWCMSSIYKDEDWADKIEILEKHQREKLVQGRWDFVKAKKTALVASRNEHYSLTDFWAYFIVYKMLKELDETKLSEQKKSCENGKNPYPIYAAVDKHTYSGNHAGSWFEFTPHDAGAPGTAGNPATTANIDINHLGSEFKNGKLDEEKKERDVCYLQGLWGSALASEQEIKKAIIGALLDFLKKDRESYFSSKSEDLGFKSLNLLSWAYQYVLELQLCALDVSATSAERFFDLLENLLKIHRTSKSYKVLREMRQNWSCADTKTREEGCKNLWDALNKDFGVPEEIYIPDIPFSPLQGIKDWIRHVHKTNVNILTWTWGTTSNFLHNCPGVVVPELKTKEVVSLIDAGLAINTAYPLVLHPERHVKLILSFDFSAGDPFETVKKAAEYFKTRGIKFPKIDESQLQDKDNPSNCYIFRGDDLTVMHFPLFNTVNCQDKIAEYHKTFSTFKLSYSDAEIEKLLNAAKMNVATVKERVLEEIKNIVGPHSQRA
ncbi:cytosolic phospholipase A2 gamma-like isoform X1 [Elgaria multicarinata webbii]|uniref:cytosolic phospholipase A2 gamma-like isoform X1 n=1 Tax=Elgaria multicarinata webbii TaxID=159646 RepID=UPI002FCCCBB6